MLGICCLLAACTVTKPALKENDGESFKEKVQAFVSALPPRQTFVLTIVGDEGRYASELQDLFEVLYHVDSRSTRSFHFEDSPERFISRCVRYLGLSNSECETILRNEIIDNILGKLHVELLPLMKRGIRVVYQEQNDVREHVLDWHDPTYWSEFTDNLLSCNKACDREARELAKRASDDPNAMYSIGLCLVGDSRCQVKLPKNAQLGLDYFEKASELGHARSSLELAFTYLYNSNLPQGIPQDIRKREYRRWILIACEQELEVACHSSIEESLALDDCDTTKKAVSALQKSDITRSESLVKRAKNRCGFL